MNERIVYENGKTQSDYLKDYENILFVRWLNELLNQNDEKGDKHTKKGHYFLDVPESYDADFCDVTSFNMPQFVEV